MASDAPSVLIVLDLETTGLDHRTERIIEIGAVRLENGQVAATFDTLVKPDVPIRKSSYNVHNISQAMVEDAPPIEDVLPRLLEFMGEHPIVAHNAIFDYSFVNEASKRLYDKRLPNRRIDTYEIYRILFPDEPSHGLSSMLAKFGFPSYVSHRALDDALNLARVYPQLIDLYEQQHAWQFSQLDNVPYLAERYHRLQRTIQMLQAEVSDLREIFKLYFAQGGQPIQTSTGEVMVSAYRRNYEYNEHLLRQIIEDAGLANQVMKLNTKAIDKLVGNSRVDVDVRNAIKDARILMSENRMISFIKPSEATQTQDVTDGENVEEATE